MHVFICFYICFYLVDMCLCFACYFGGILLAARRAALQMGLVQCQSSGAQTLCLVVCHPCGWAGVHNMLDATCNCPVVSRLERCWSGTLATQHTCWGHARFMDGSVSINLRQNQLPQLKTPFPEFLNSLLRLEREIFAFLSSSSNFSSCSFIS